MDLLTLLTLAVGLAMDAFAVSICKGLAMREKVLKKGIIVGLWFGGFQALMPTIGFFLGTQFKDHIDRPLDRICASWADRNQYGQRSIIK